MHLVAKHVCTGINNKQMIIFEAEKDTKSFVAMEKFNILFGSIYLIWLYWSTKHKQRIPYCQQGRK